MNITAVDKPLKQSHTSVPKSVHGSIVSHQMRTAPITFRCLIAATGILLLLSGTCISAESADELLRKADEYVSNQQYAQAFETYQRALSLDTSSSRDALIRFGETLIKAGRLNESITAFRDAIAVDPDFAPSYAHVARVLSDTGLYDDAAAWYTAALNRDPSLAQDRLDLGKTLLALNKIDAARKHLDPLFKLDPVRAEELREAIAAFTNTPATPADK